MGAIYPELYAAIVIHSCLACGAARDVSSALLATRQGSVLSITRAGRKTHVPTIVFHGDADKTVHPANADEIIAMSKAVSHRATTLACEAPGGMRYTRTIQSDAEGRPVVEKWILHGAGHAWSGGSSEGSYTEPLGPDASREMVRFFLEHRVRDDQDFDAAKASVAIAS